MWLDGPPIVARQDVTLMTEPPPDLMISGTAWRQQWKVPRRSRSDLHVDFGDHGVARNRTARGIVQDVEAAVLHGRAESGMHAVLAGHVRRDKNASSPASRISTMVSLPRRA
jgi:hypothetical protein